MVTDFDHIKALENKMDNIIRDAEAKLAEMKEVLRSLAHRRSSMSFVRSWGNPFLPAHINSNLNRHRHQLSASITRSNPSCSAITWSLSRRLKLSRFGRSSSTSTARASKGSRSRSTARLLRAGRSSKRKGLTEREGRRLLQAGSLPRDGRRIGVKCEVCMP